MSVKLISHFTEGQEVEIVNHVNSLLNGKRGTIVSISSSITPPIIVLVNGTRYYIAPGNLKIVEPEKPQKVPFRDKFDEWIGAHPFTHDIVAMNMRQWTFLFVYGTLKSTMSRGGMLADEVKLPGFASSVRNNFEMVWCVDGDFPVLIDNPGGSSPVGVIKGELYKVRPEVIFQLDRIENNGRMFQRTMEQFTYKDRDGTVENVTAWVYKANHRFWAPLQHKLEEMKIRGEGDRKYWFLTTEDVRNMKKTA